MSEQKTICYVCQECGEAATVEGEQAIDPMYNTPYIAEWVVCRECGYTIPKATADVALLLETCEMVINASEADPNAKPSEIVDVINWDMLYAAIAKAKSQ